ncbi:hypothetical protein EYF80_031089 [Liparis tanakae]|uniref:Uncharacterized protein n=1 Tax=Liparis tanakae TaxID=230148 RepID=A0A4Z2GZZ2_9TELE|nr:hypothetical protein EYF80_031089 [Liparis tanakae]
MLVQHGPLRWHCMLLHPLDVSVHRDILEELIGLMQRNTDMTFSVSQCFLKTPEEATPLPPTFAHTAVEPLNGALQVPREDPDLLSAEDIRSNHL